MPKIIWKIKDDKCVEAWVNGEYAGFVAKHGSWKGCVYLKPFVVIGQNDYIYEHGAGRTKEQMIDWVIETIKHKSYLR